MAPGRDPRIDSIIREARLRFVTDGYAAARIEPISRAAGVSTATLYTFFPSKAHLFEAVIEAASQEFYDRVSVVASNSQPSRERMTEYLVGYAEFLSDAFVRKMFRLVMAERPRFNDKAVEFFDKGRGDIAHELITMVETLAEDSVLKVHKPSWAITQLLGMIEYPLLLLPLASGKDPVQSRNGRAIVEDAIETFWARYAA
ncbi:TetR/AcrR family transcriptional regulator [uncultured Brevundimonas sp.]|uniref:TetR/AcrR family transcriptional regulator n=1 Tax=uncultured Brevundimonas sp. TaxID=213418 RepID=UPI002618B4AA|nr:TetR/AcrR family transcriptional regulator [uncultured Brevundimonas sp.]